MDRIIENHLKHFSTTHSIEDIPSPKQFEHFVNYSVVSKYYPETIDTHLITTEEPESGIDGIAFVIDGDLITTAGDAEKIFLRPKREIETLMIFTQAKTSEKFKRADVLKFSDAVKDFIKDKPKLPINECLLEAHKIFGIILKNVAKVSHGRPKCHCFFVTTGRYNEETEIAASFKNMEDGLKETDLFVETKVFPVSKHNLIELWTATWAKVETILNVKSWMPLPPMKNVSQAYLVVVSAKDFVQEVLTSAEGGLRSYIFEENVRAFLGVDAPVNEKMIATLSDDNLKDKFSTDVPPSYFYDIENL